jgi:hypothetical protein
MKSIIALEFNEISFEYIQAYVNQGELPNFAAVLLGHGCTETTSESKYEELEPWIQWVTAHTGRPFCEHGVFRLGDFGRTDLPQIWEQLEAEGLKVGAVSPMNAANRLKNPAFFMPDPWTDTPSSGSWLFRELGRAISQTVNDNTQAQVTPKSAVALLLGASRYAYPSRYGQYLRDGLTSRGRPWRRAIVLDRLIAHVFEHEWCKHRPDFASVFLNGAAFIQHHYLFSSAVYDGNHENPEWYVSPGEDPLLEVYRLYDDILGRMMRYGARVMVATGLHQVPYGQSTYYWRLRDHEATLRNWGVPFKDVQPRMSRDFLVVCHDKAEAATAAAVLGSARAQDGEPLFEVDRRENDLFAMLTYLHDIPPGFRMTIGGRQYDGFKKGVAFVAIKNGHHHGTGYFIDTGEHASQRPPSIPLAELKDRMMKAFDLEGGRDGRRAVTGAADVRS